MKYAENLKVSRVTTTPVIWMQHCSQCLLLQAYSTRYYIEKPIRRYVLFINNKLDLKLFFLMFFLKDIAQYSEVQNVLRNEIVNPLRKNMFVRADRVMKLRKLLDQLSSVSGLTSEEKDPEEVLNSLLSQIMRVEPFLKVRRFY